MNASTVVNVPKFLSDAAHLLWVGFGSDEVAGGGLNTSYGKRGLAAALVGSGAEDDGFQDVESKNSVLGKVGTKWERSRNKRESEVEFVQGGSG